MILADTSIWIDYLRGDQPLLKTFLQADTVVIHSMVVGEVAVGSIRERVRVLSQMFELPKAVRAHDYLVLQLIEGHQLFGRGLSYIDMHLLASVRLMPRTRLWTRDKALAAAAAQLDVVFQP